ncbi:MAG: SPFH domain-containing protein [Woeseiaceae bacterium]|nr:SPFH domain-containing protein [Woeseiaceae bacterium]
MFENRVTSALPTWLRLSIVSLVTFVIAAVMFNQVFFYAEPGYVYHVRTITGNERVVDGVGYSMHLFGRVNAWKKAMTVLADDVTADGVNAESESSIVSASLPPLNIMFLDQVDADAMAAVRFRLPTDAETFLRMAHEYRTPENLLRVALIPSFQETLQATASLMSAEDYYSGGRTEFINEFENQMQQGIYIVKRKEIMRDMVKRQTSEADASNPELQDEFGDQQKAVFVVEKLIDESTGMPIRKEQKFMLYGITVHEARVTNMKPNAKFVARMEQKQEASAMRAIAREQKVQEEEQRLLAIARGDREVAERQAAMKVEQVEATTKAETRKKETLIEAQRQKQAAEIQEETSKILLEKARIDAEAVKVAAEAEAYRKERILSADNALAQKLDAEIEIQRIWAEAFAKRAVPQNVFGGGGNGETPTGSDMEVKHFMQLLTLEAAERLNYDRNVVAE